MPLFLIFLGVLFIPLFSAQAEGQTYSYPDLVHRMTDLRSLAKLPPAGEKAGLASSYDRSSQYDAAHDKYLNWGANLDSGGIVRQEGNENVLMDVKGPGCIWRIWAATVADGHVKIYLDGVAEPTVDLPFGGYFDGKTAPFDRPNIVYIPSAAAHGYDNYTPISFAKSCKVVADPGWGQYYQFTYTLFPADTVVPTFSMHLSADDSAALDKANEILGASGHYPSNEDMGQTLDVPLTLGAGQTLPVADLSGAGAITALKVKLPLPIDPEEQVKLLRSLTISITWDGQSSPAVWSTLGDFFGYVGGADKFQSLPMGLMKDGTFYSYWYMPFGQSAHIEVGNDSSTPVTMEWQVSHAPLTGRVVDYTRFHAKWHRDAFLPTRSDRWPDWTLLTTTGAGRYVGTHLSVWNRSDWWGEGDDKFFVNGEKFPSIYGTGAEDYFGYAWSAPGHFSRAYHNQILNTNNSGQIDDNRFHIPDSIPFQTSLEASIEKYFPNARPTLFAAESFWYLSAEGNDPYPRVPVENRVGYEFKRPAMVVPGAIEAESLKPIGPVARFEKQDMFIFGDGWSNDSQLFWRPTAIGDTLRLALPEQKPGKYKVIAGFTRAVDYGTFQISLDDVALGLPVDLYLFNKVAPSGPIELGEVTLTAGSPVLTVMCTGKNIQSPRFAFGLDYIQLISEP